MKAPILRFRSDEADLIAIVLMYVGDRMTSETIYSDVDRPARRFTKRRINDVLAHLRRAFPNAGKETEAPK